MQLCTPLLKVMRGQRQGSTGARRRMTGSRGILMTQQRQIVGVMRVPKNGRATIMFDATRTNLNFSFNHDAGRDALRPGLHSTITLRRYTPLLPSGRRLLSGYTETILDYPSKTRQYTSAMPKAPKKKYYAVKVGQEGPKIYESWQEV